MRDSGKPLYEADFVYFNLNTLHLTEIEIKTDINDFRSDFKKARYHDNHNVMYLYYAIPRDLYDDHYETIDKLLGDAGLILIDEIDTFDFRGNIYEFGGYKKNGEKKNWFC